MKCDICTIVKNWQNMKEIFLIFYLQIAPSSTLSSFNKVHIRILQIIKRLLNCKYSFQDYLNWMGLHSEFHDFGGITKPLIRQEFVDVDNKTYEQYSNYEFKLFGRISMNWYPICNS